MFAAYSLNIRLCENVVKQSYSVAAASLDDER